jgi:hypothetical protein
VRKEDEARLAAALRENLRRRKARSRALAEGGHDEGGPAAEESRSADQPLDPPSAAAKP